MEKPLKVLKTIYVANKEYHRILDIVSAMQSQEKIGLCDNGGTVYAGQIQAIELEDGSGQNFNIKIVTEFGASHNVFIRAL